MARLVWDGTGDKLYETGVDRVVLYLQGTGGAYSKGVAWNGVTSFSENPTGAESNSEYADNIKYLNLISAEDMESSIEAYTYPPEWAECDGSVEVAPGVYIGQQNRKAFGLAVRTLIGNDVDGQDHGYKLHLLYGAQASTSERTYETMNDSPEAITFSWDITTTPVNVSGHKPTASLIIDTTKADATKVAALEAILYGDESNEPRLPLPDEVIELMKSTDPGSRMEMPPSMRRERR